MERVIKFSTLWKNKKTGKIRESIIELKITPAWLSLPSESSNAEDLIAVREFTGLHDKNGKEIYEGDIVEAWSEGYKHTGEVRFRLEAQPCYIIYPAFANQGFWKIHGQKNRKGIYTDDGVEVIGNIYENPELI